ncbi:MAG TPA: subclass B1 metallo-beta-lactamase [Longimicrobium sp.]|nr:subclass B1 metallo-beta-lactamase [Longimicrobium sp.]
MNEMRIVGALSRMQMIAITAGLTVAALFGWSCHPVALRAVPQTAEVRADTGDLMGVGSPAYAPREVRQLAPDVRVARLAPGLWVHTTTATLGGVLIPANGMLLETADGSVLFDTGWNDAQAEALMAWARDVLRHPVRRAVVTHFHEDRLGGIGALRRAGVDVRGSEMTRQLAERAGTAAPDPIIGLEVEPQGDPSAGYEVRYAGPGHTRDNVVIWFPGQQAIFGGCLVKSDTATTVGNVRDADVAAWPRTVATVRGAYPAVRLVVPGHGRVSGPQALTHTEQLIATKGGAGNR